MALPAAERYAAWQAALAKTYECARQARTAGEGVPRMVAYWNCRAKTIPGA